MDGSTMTADMRASSPVLREKIVSWRYDFSGVSEVESFSPEFMGFSWFFQTKKPYLYVEIDARLPERVKPKFNLMEGIYGNAKRRVGFSRGLLQFSQWDPTIVVFRKDGAVIELQHADGLMPNVVQCDVEKALDHRLDYVEWLLEQRQGLACNELVRMLEALQQVREIDERNRLQMKVVCLLVDLRDEGSLYKEARINLVGVLNGCSDMVRWAYHSNYSSDIGDDKPVTAEQVKLRQQRLAKRTENLQQRAAANQSHVKGPSPTADSFKKGNQNKKK